MKILLLRFSVLFMITFIGCEVAPEQKKTIQKEIVHYGPVTKVISSKEAPIENRFSAGDFFFGSGSISKSQTVYYFFAEDGTMVEVDLRTYASKKVGDNYSANWK